MTQAQESSQRFPEQPELLLWRAHSSCDPCQTEAQKLSLSPVARAEKKLILRAPLSDRELENEPCPHFVPKGPKEGKDGKAMTMLTLGQRHCLQASVLL